MTTRTGLKLALAGALLLGTISQLGSTTGATDTTTGAADELVSASSSRCLSVAAASPGDIAVVNITNTGATGTGWGALRSSDATPVFNRPAADQYASVNFAAGTPPNPNLAFTKIGPDNRFCYDAAVSSHEAILDLTAIIPAANINAIDPTRLLDTRETSTVTANSTRCVEATGASDGDVAVVNITNTGATGEGWGALRPFNDFPDNPFTGPVFDLPEDLQFSSVNFAADTPPNPNLAFTMLGSGNRFCYDGAVSSHEVILDLAAIIPGANIDSEVERVIDTRGDQPLSANSSICVAAPGGAVAGDIVVVNIANTGATGTGWGALRSSDDIPVFNRATADQYASVNFATDTPPNPNLAFARVGSDNEFCYDGAESSHDVILDLAAIIPAASIDAIDPTRILDTRTENPPPTTTATTTTSTTTTTTTIAAPPNPGDSKNCGDFATYTEAKAWFDTYFPFYGDIANLDADGDGEPCESLPGGPG